MSYRDPSLVYRDVWEWDIILVHGAVNVIGRNHAHLDDCAWQAYGANCKCDYSQPKISSPILSPWGKPLQEDMYEPLGPRGTGEAHYLLGAQEGCQIPVMSGKTYRLNGPRVPAGSPWTRGSIWIALVPEPEPEPVAAWWKRWGRRVRVIPA